MSKTIEKVNSNIKPSEFFKKLDLSKLDANTAQYIREEILSFGNTDLLDGTPEFEEVRKMIEDNYPQALGIIPVPEKDIEEHISKKTEPKIITGKVNKKEQKELEKKEKEAAKQEHKQKVSEISDMIELMQDTVKGNPNDADSKDYLDLLQDTLADLRKKKFETGGEINNDNDDIKLKYIGELIKQGNTSGYNPNWTLRIDFDGEIDDSDRQHIAKLVSESYTSGEIVSGEESERGWWSIEFGDDKEMKDGGEIPDNDPELKKLLQKIEDNQMVSSDGKKIRWYIRSTESPKYNSLKDSFQTFDFEIKPSGAFSKKWKAILYVDHVPVFEQEEDSKLGSEVLIIKIKKEVAKKILSGVRYDFIKFENGGGIGKWNNYDENHLINTETGMIVVKTADLTNIKTSDIKGFDILDPKGYSKGGGVGEPKISYNKYWSKHDGTVYDQKVKIDRATFEKLKDNVQSEIALKYPRKSEYVSTSGYEFYLKPLVIESNGVVELNHTQARFINLFLKLDLKDRNTRLYVVNKYENGGEVSDDIKERLEYLRGELQAERISQGELIELQSLAKHIDPSDVELLEAAGVPEHNNTELEGKYVYKFHEERGEISAYVENMATGEEVWSFKYPNYSLPEEDREFASSPVQDGFMRHFEDISGLENYLKDLSAIPNDAQLLSESEANKLGYYKNGGGIKSWYKTGGEIIKTKFNSHENHNPEYDILEGHLDNDSYITYAIKVKGNNIGKESMEYYVGENYKVGSKKKSFSRHYESNQIPEKYKALWLKLKELYETKKYDTGGGIDDNYIQVNDLYIDKNTFAVTTREGVKVHQGTSLEDSIAWANKQYSKGINNPTIKTPKGRSFELSATEKMKSGMKIYHYKWIDAPESVIAYTKPITTFYGEVPSAKLLDVYADQMLSESSNPDFKKNGGSVDEPKVMYSDDWNAWFRIKNGKLQSLTNWGGEIKLSELERKIKKEKEKYGSVDKSADWENVTKENSALMSDDDIEKIKLNIKRLYKEGGFVTVKSSFNNDTDTWFDGLADLSKEMKGNEKLEKLLSITNKAATKNNLTEFKKILKKCECPSPELKKNILSHLDKVLGQKYKKEFRFSFGGNRGSGGRASAASEFFSMFNQAATYNYSKGGNVSSDIDRMKASLVAKAKKKGLYENFGQDEVRKLEDKYGRTAEVNDFDNWAMNFDLSQLKKGGSVGITYEIIGYKTKEDFENRNGQILDEGITSRKEAMDTAKDLYNNEPHAIMKVQSSDREFIKILDEHKDYDEDDYAKGGGIKNKERVEVVLKHYLIAALWSSTDSDNEDTPFDTDYDVEDFDKKTVDKARQLIIKFMIDNEADLKASGLDDEQIGHDLWLTQVGHGAGFWDREGVSKEVGNRLSEESKKLGQSANLYAENGKVYIDGLSNPDEMAKGGGVWIKDALSGGKNKGALRRTAMRKGLLRNEKENLSKTDLHKLEKMGGTTAKRAHLAETLSKFDTGGDIKDGKNGYVAFYKGKQMDVWGDTSLQARDKAAKAFKAKKAWDVTVVLAEKDGEQVTHVADFKRGGKVGKKFGVYVFGSLYDSFSDELTADEYARLTKSIHPKWRIEVKPI